MPNKTENPPSLPVKKWVVFTEITRDDGTIFRAMHMTYAWNQDDACGQVMSVYKGYRLIRILPFKKET
jgi:hypothetical protein